jgi:hypothetical protein
MLNFDRFRASYYAHPCKYVLLFIALVRVPKAIFRIWLWSETSPIVAFLWKFYFE